MEAMHAINLRGRLYSFDSPKVMGIINVTPDSFYGSSRVSGREAIRRRAAEMVSEGVDIFDVGGYSTRPGAEEISPREEMERLAPALEILKEDFPEIPVSVDTFRAGVAEKCVREFGADIINDVGGGTLDPEMFGTVASLSVPYILMHMRGTPATMQTMTDYGDVTADVISDLAFKADRLRQLGVADIIIDPGFGFAKTIEQNYQLLAGLPEFRRLGMPILAGMSRKSMIWRPLNITPDKSLPGTITLHTYAMLAGADIIRVHDVAAAVQSARVAGMILKQLRSDGSFTLSNEND